MKRILLTAILAVSALQVADINASNSDKPTSSDKPTRKRQISREADDATMVAERKEKLVRITIQEAVKGTKGVKVKFLHQNDQKDASMRMLVSELDARLAPFVEADRLQNEEAIRLAQESMLRSHAYQLNDLEHSENMVRAALEEKYLAEFQADLQGLSLSPEYVKSMREAVQKQVTSTEKQQDQAAAELESLRTKLAIAEKAYRIAQEKALRAADQKQQHTNDWAVDAYVSPELVEAQEALKAAREALATAQRNPLLRAWSWCTGFFRK